MVTIDAMGCQKKIAAALVEAKADYLLALKDNHPTLRQEVQQFFELLESHETKYSMVTLSTTDGDHGRIEERRYTLTESIDQLPDREEWAGLRSIGMVESRRMVGGRASVERRYFLTTLREADIQCFAHKQRRHWAVENELHWVLDVGLREDESRVREGHGASNLAILRRLVVSTLRRNKSVKIGAQNKRLRAAVHEAYRSELVSQLLAEAA